MKKYIIYPVRADMFYSPEYQRENLEIYQDSLNNGFMEIFGKKYLDNGLLSINSWSSEHILKSFELSNFRQYILVSKSLKEAMAKTFDIDENHFLPIAYGWEIDSFYTDNVSLPDFYSFSVGFINEESKQEFIAIRNIEGLPIQIIVTEQFLNILLTFDNENFEYEVFLEGSA